MKKFILIILSILFAFAYGAKKEVEKYPNGNKKSVVKLKNGLKHGKYKAYYKNGEIQIKGNYENDNEDGTWIFYSDKGEILGQLIYENGSEKEGKFFKYYDNGSLKGQGNYKDGKKDGKWTYYRDVKWIQNRYNENGKIYKEGNYIYKEGNYKDGKEDGKWTEYYETGQIEEERNYKDGSHISNQRYNKDGSKKESPYIGGSSGSSHSSREKVCQDPYGNWHSVMSDCSTCGITYCLAILPYGKYCSQKCCAAVENLSNCGY